MRNKIDMKEMADVMNAITHWESISNHFTQLLQCFADLINKYNIQKV